MENEIQSATPQKELSLYAKLAKIMGSVGWVKKSGRNTFFNYDYAKEADILDAVRERLAEYSVMMTTSVESMEFKDTGKTTRGGEKVHLVFVKTKHTFFDGDSDKTLEVFGCGSGEDSGDKAIYKAITGAMKYVITKNFLIPTGDDPEKDDEEKEAPRGGQHAPSNIPIEPLPVHQDYTPAQDYSPDRGAPYNPPLPGNQCRDFVKDIQSKTGPKKDGSMYTRYSIETRMNGFFTTFNGNFANVARDARNSGEEVLITFKANGRWKDMEDIRTTAERQAVLSHADLETLPF